MLLGIWMHLTKNWAFTTNRIKINLKVSFKTFYALSLNQSLFLRWKKDSPYYFIWIAYLPK